jgi:hypothetical protein
MKKENSKNKVSYNWDKDEPRIKSTKNVRKKRRHNTKENLKDVVQGNLDYDDYMEMEDWSDSR